MKHPFNKLSIEHDGYKLTPSENLKARFGRFVMMGQAIHEGKMVNVIDDATNPFVQHYVDEAYERKRRRKQPRRLQDEDMTTVDWLKAGTYELGTLAVPRQMGMMAVRAAARFGLDKLSMKEGAIRTALAEVHEFTDSRLEEAEQGLHNPTFRKKSGYNLRELRERRAAKRAERADAA